MQNYSKKNRLFLILGLFFITHVFIAEFIGVKIFSLEKSLGFMSGVNWNLGGGQALSFNLTAGVLIWPVVFLMTDIINEYYGKSGVRILSYWAAGLIAYSFVIVYTAIQLSPADFWPATGQEKGVPDMNLAFKMIFGQGNWIIVGSLFAFLVGQFVDVFSFQFIRRFTGSGKIWLRATGSTLISQLVDTFVVLYIAFYIGADWPLERVLAVGLMNYIYKFIIAILVTPLLYLGHYGIDAYLGKDLAIQMKNEAAQSSFSP